MYGDACHWATTMPDTPVTTVDEFVAALASRRSRDASEPVDITLDGYAGKSITLQVPDDVDLSECDPGSGGSWDCGGDGTAVRLPRGPGEIDTRVHPRCRRSIMAWTHVVLRRERPRRTWRSSRPSSSRPRSASRPMRGRPARAARALAASEIEPLRAPGCSVRVEDRRLRSDDGVRCAVEVAPRAPGSRSTAIAVLASSPAARDCRRLIAVAVCDRPRRDASRQRDRCDGASSSSAGS